MSKKKSATAAEKSHMKWRENVCKAQRHIVSQEEENNLLIDS